MNKKLLTLTLVLCMIVLAGCKAQEKKECQNVGCLGTVSCEYRSGLIVCPMMLVTDSICTRFASCQEVGGECVINKTDDYDKCHACYDGCEGMQGRNWTNCDTACNQVYEAKIQR